MPADLDYAAVRGLSMEVQQKLTQHRPETIGQAARIQGVTPAAISLLLVHLKRRRSRRAAAREAQRMSLAAADRRGARGDGPRLARGSARSQLAALPRAHREMEPRAQPHGGARDRPDGGRCTCSTASRVLPHLGGAKNLARRRQRARASRAFRWRSRAPTSQVTLLDSSHKKCAFLEQAKAELGLANVRSCASASSSWKPDAHFDVVVSRAFSELADFVAQAQHLVAPGGRAARDEGRASVRGDRARARRRTAWRRWSSSRCRRSTPSATSSS